MKNKFKVFALVCVLLLTSGCGTSNYIKDDEGNIVEFEETGQMLQKDILCLPEENSELYSFFIRNLFNYSKCYGYYAWHWPTHFLHCCVYLSIIVCCK